MVLMWPLWSLLSTVHRRLGTTGAVRAWIGTSGWQYRDWRGSFYPRDLAAGRWLETYASRYRTVEVNNSFYRLPPRSVFEEWARRTPDDFVFVVKASRYLSHVKRLADPEEPVGRLLEHAQGLGSKLGPVLLQLPPTLQRDLDRLDRTLSCFAARGARVAVEFRHPTWFEAATYSLLAGHGAALCLTDRLNRRGPVEATSGWTYLRLHEGRATPRPCYGTTALRSWVATLAGVAADEAWVFFNNDPRGCAPANARTFARLAAAAGLDPTRFPDEPLRVHSGA